MREEAKLDELPFAFGVASASYYWSRVAGAVGRLAQYLVVSAAATWHMLVADDYLLECGGAAYRRGLLTFFVLCAVLGVPLSWHKTSGGDVLVSVVIRAPFTFQVCWHIRQTCRVVCSLDSKDRGLKHGQYGLFEEGLGCIMFVAGALEHERPFLGPLYRFISIHPRDSTRRIPPYVKFILRYLASEITKQRHYHCSSKLTTVDCMPRVDAQASAQRPLDPSLSSWFSLKISKDEFP